VKKSPNNGNMERSKEYIKEKGKKENAAMKEVSP
jgi:hypothetical protein